MGGSRPPRAAADDQLPACQAFQYALGNEFGDRGAGWCQADAVMPRESLQDQRVSQFVVSETGNNVLLDVLREAHKTPKPYRLVAKMTMRVGREMLLTLSPKKRGKWSSARGDEFMSERGRRR